ncbi:MAG: lipoyl domain-containing protein [Candidatus Contubernalis sp.]|nr:lipoyl domain-containing protein [Candidatus Contubernalis sp.]
MTYLQRVPLITPEEQFVRLVSWKKSSGDYVRAGEPLVVFETSKATAELEAEESGYLVEIYLEEDRVMVDNVFAVLKQRENQEISRDVLNVIKEEKAEARALLEELELDQED